MNKDWKIAVSGTYSTGKTTLTEALSLLTGIPCTRARTMREILPEAIPGKTLEECAPTELFQLGILRFVERAVRESHCRGIFFSDGSSLHEWIYGKARMIVGINPNDGLFVRTVKLTMMLPFKKIYSDVIETFGAIVKQHAKKTYTEFIHLPVEFPLVADGHRPVSERFRNLSDLLLRQTLDELGIKYHVVSGTVEERLEKIIKIYNLKAIMSIEDAATEARKRVAAQRVQIEADAVAAKRKLGISWYGRFKKGILQ